MRLSSTILGVVAALALAPAIVHGGPGSKPQKAGKPATTAKPTTSAKPAVSPKMASKPAAQAAPKPTPKNAHKPAPSARVASTSTHPAGKPAAAGKPAKAPSTASTTTTAPKNAKHGGTTTVVTTTNTAQLNPIAAKIASKPNLNAKLTTLLPIDPMTGRTMTLDKASLGFKNQGQFIAALHVSQNLGIPFTELKRHMVTLQPGAPGELPTATQTGSLGQAIQASKKTANVTTEVQKAELQASADLGVTTTTIKTTPKGGVR